LVKIGGVGAGAWARFFNIELIVLDKTFYAQVGFTDGAPARHGLLGVIDFFSQFRVAFDQESSEWRVLLTPI
jgi:hypothetical protein